MHEGRARVIIADVQPAIDGARFPTKRIVGESLLVTAVAFCDGHDLVRVELQHRPHGAQTWSSLRMEARGNDRYEASLRFDALGRYELRVHAWVDTYASWLRDAHKFHDAGALEAVHLEMGARLLEAHGLAELASKTRTGALVENVSLPPRFVTASQIIHVDVERERALYGAWYELFPRSLGGLQQTTAALDAVAAMGFDVLYLPPIHPIGTVHRKGKNNAREAAAGDVGSPWAIGSAHGGHMEIEPSLGTFEDFDALLARAAALGLEIAMDIAFQCAPDHPWVSQHPGWFKQRPDGRIQYAENPPKKYEDIYPLDFECEDWRALWAALEDVFLFWCRRGVRAFRVDNPHTKSFPFWEHCLARVREAFPDAIFLAEAFTRPGPMYHLAKIGFSQSYTYFTWRNSAAELREFMTELTRVADFYRPNLWPNTPDILSEVLQTGGKAAFQARLVLAATLGASYGIYGPAYENMENAPRSAGSEEYLHSEKYELKARSDAKNPLRTLITLLNSARREHPALQQNRSLRFHATSNEQLLCYSKRAGSDVVIVVVNLDPHHRHTGFVDLDMDGLGLSANERVQVHDLISDARYLWQGARQYVELDPQQMPAHVFALRHHVRTEHDFDYFA